MISVSMMRYLGNTSKVHKMRYLGNTSKLLNLGKNSKGLLRKILNDVCLSVEEYDKLRK